MLDHEVPTGKLLCGTVYSYYNAMVLTTAVAGLVNLQYREMGRYRWFTRFVSRTESDSGVTVHERNSLKKCKSVNRD